MRNIKNFEDVKTSTLTNVSNLLRNKGAEYATLQDRYHNFNIASQMIEKISPVTTPAKAAYCFMVKHFVSLVDLLNADNLTNNKIIDEKIDDIIAYLVLIKGMLLEKSTDGGGDGEPMG
jgi:hypothetical protein